MSQDCFTFIREEHLSPIFLAKSERNIYIVDKSEFSWNLMARIFQQNDPIVHIQGTNGIPHK